MSTSRLRKLREIISDDLAALSYLPSPELVHSHDPTDVTDQRLAEPSTACTAPQRTAPSSADGSDLLRVVGDSSPPVSSSVGDESTSHLKPFDRAIPDPTFTPANPGAANMARKKGAAVKAKKREERVFKQQAMSRQMKRTERYLGLRPKLSHLTDPETESHAGWVERQEAIHAYQAAIKVPPTDPSQSARFPFDQSVVFVAIDVETYERNHDIVTEVGVATLDTDELREMPPGPDGAEWASKICARHFRIREHASLTNHEFVSGCADRFEFGDSEFICLVDCRDVLSRCFLIPTSKQDEVTGRLEELTVESWTGKEGTSVATEVEDDQARRHIILVGHDVDHDIDCLRKLGCDPFDAGNIVEVVDTSNLWRVWKRDTQSTSLGAILYDFEQTTWNLHNAGNDARYTLQALLAIIVRGATMRGTTALARQREETLLEREAAAATECVQRIREDAAGWESDPDRPDLDGGDAATLTIPT